MNHRVPITRFEEGKAPEQVADEVAEEEPLEIRVRGRAVSVTMRTGGNDEELAAGFLLSEGLIARRADILRIEPCPHDRGGNIVNIVLAAHVAVDFDRLTRHVFGSSSCGLCGKATIDAVHQKIDPIETPVSIDAATLLALPGQLRDSQPTFDRTGGLHAAAIFTVGGHIVCVREDVGRHNAVDKVLGYGLLADQLPFGGHILMVSGRTSFEIMQKALAGGVAAVASVSAPSSLAVEFARESGQLLVGFLRSGRMNVYSQPASVRWQRL